MVSFTYYLYTMYPLPIYTLTSFHFRLIEWMHFVKDQFRHVLCRNLAVIHLADNYSYFKRWVWLELGYNAVVNISKTNIS